MAYDPLGTRLDGTDDRFLTLLARHGKLSRDHVDTHVYGTRDRSTRHIKRLRNLGLINTTDRPAMRRFYGLTRDGANAARPLLTLPIDVPEDSAYGADLHTLAVTDWCLRTAATGTPVLTEREIHWLTNRPEEAEIAIAELGVTSDVQPIEYPGPNGGRVFNWVSAAVGTAGRTHRPDAITVNTDGRYVAVEIELTPKPVPELRANLRAYATASPFDTVVYFGTPAVLRRMKTVAERLDTARPIRDWLRLVRLDDITCEWVRRSLWNRLHERDEGLTMDAWRQVSGGNPYTP